VTRAAIDSLYPWIRAKSSGTSLRSHLAITGQVAHALLRAVGYPQGSDVLVCAAALHDLGKLDPAFQACLDGGPWHCHEDDAPGAIREFLMDGASRKWLAEIARGELRPPETEGELQGHSPRPPPIRTGGRRRPPRGAHRQRKIGAIRRTLTDRV
jgi:hypothetical protein